MGISTYIGLPQKDSNELLNTPEFREVWQRTENQHLEAISLLATLLQTEDDVIIAIYNYFSIKEHICNLLLKFHF